MVEVMAGLLVLDKPAPQLEVAVVAAVADISLEPCVTLEATADQG
jgi:hypothetical protein